MEEAAGGGMADPCLAAEDDGRERQHCQPAAATRS